MELRHTTSCHHTYNSTTTPKKLRRSDLIEMKSISNDRARCDASDDMSFNQNSRDL